MRLKTLLKIVKINIIHRFYYSIGKIEKIIPYKVLIQLTNDCNSKCTSCRIWEINKVNPSLKKLELKSENFEKLFKELGNHLYWLSLSGGEVTLSSDIREQIKIAKKHCLNLSLVTFTTNGLLPEKALELALAIQKMKLELFVTISLDGSEKLHDSIRGIEGNYQKAFTTYQMLKDKNINAHFGITLSERNSEFIEHDFQKYREVIKAVTFVHDYGIYQTSNNDSLDKIKHSMKRVYRMYCAKSIGELFEKFYIKLGVIFLEAEKKKNIIPCSAGLSSLHISPYGDFSPCMFLPNLGNIKSESIVESFNNEKYSKERLNPINGKCGKCWMNCYAPHSIMFSPFKSIVRGVLGK